MVNRLLIVFVIYILACGEAYAENINAEMFLGPKLGETIVLEHSDDGGITKRTCTFISDLGEYYIEERTRLPKRDINPKGFPAEIVKMMGGEADIVNNYKLQAEGGRLILNSITYDGEKNILVDLATGKWSQLGKSKTDKIKMNYSVVKEEQKNVLGKLRKLVHVKYTYDFEGIHYAQLYVLASGLGIIYRESLSPGESKPTSILVEE